ncbi:MAG: DEAD/DEAH box helicase, partial [Nanoarchaeota archaeon]
MDELNKIKPREYQQKIFESCKDKNCLVVLPTGVGKTLIALMLAIHILKTQKGKVLFLAPTKPLAEQHLHYFKKHLPELFAELCLFTGKTQSKEREKLYSRADIIFSTPQCIQNDVKNEVYTLKDITLLIVDESHRSLKNYAYTYIAKKYQEQAINKRVLGLTASPGTDRKTIEQIAKNLAIESIELRTRDSDDVKEYLQDLEFKTIQLEFPPEFKEIVDIIKNMQQKKIQELRNRKVLFGPANKTQILQLQSKIMGQISSGSKNFNLFSAASAAAQAIKLAHLIELLETQTLYAVQLYVKSMFDQAAQKKSKAVQQIIKNPEFTKAY